MLSQTGLYALQALLRLASEPSEDPVPSGVMAEELEIPSNYLAKILQRLTREGILRATRGPRGGYRLEADPRLLTVARAVAPFQDLQTSRICLMGGRCDPAAPCHAHERRISWNAAALASLERTSLADLLADKPPADAPVGPATPVMENNR